VSGSITHWLSKLQDGDREATRPLWQRYYFELIRVARNQLRGLPRSIADEEDVLISAFDSFFRRAEEGRFPDLNDRTDLWRLLVVITVRKAIDRANYERRAKRCVSDIGADFDAEFLARELASDLPSPEMCAIAAETFQMLISSLADDTLQAIAIWKMEGYTNEEIAIKKDCSVRTVERKLRLIRRTWDRSECDEA